MGDELTEAAYEKMHEIKTLRHEAARYRLSRNHYRDQVAALEVELARVQAENVRLQQQLRMYEGRLEVERRPSKFSTI